MKKKLLKTLALCSALGLGVGYAVVSEQTLTYTETIPVGERALNVVIDDENATNNGTTLTVNTTVPITPKAWPSEVNLSIPIINQETDITASIDAEIKFYGDGNLLETNNSGITYTYMGIEETANWSKLLPGERGVLLFIYTIPFSAVENYSTVTVEVTITASN